MKILGTVISLFAATITGGGGCGEEPRRKFCDGPTESFDPFGTCCDERQKVKNEHGERLCDFSIVIPDGGEMPDGGAVECPTPDAEPGCEEDKIEVCVPRSLDGGTEDGGVDGGTEDAGDPDAGCVEITVCPVGQKLENDRCVDVNPPDAGNPYTALECDAAAHEVIGPAGMCEARNPCTGSGVVYTQANTCEPRRHCPDDKLEDVGGNCYASQAECTWPCPLGMVAVKPVDSPPICRNQPFAWEFACDPEREGLNTEGTCHRLFDCPPGQVMENGICGNRYNCGPNKTMDESGCRDTPFLWTNTCASNQCIGSDGVTCQTPYTPAARVQAEFLLTPDLSGRFNVRAGQVDVRFGSLVLTNMDTAFPTEVSNLVISFWIADNPAGTFQRGIDGAIRAMDRLYDCRLLEWPPSGSGFTPVAAVGSDGRITFFTGPLPVTYRRFFDVVCSLNATAPNGPTDGLATELESAQATLVQGQTRTTVPFILTRQNGGSTPTVAAIVSP